MQLNHRGFMTKLDENARKSVASKLAISAVMSLVAILFISDPGEERTFWDFVFGATFVLSVVALVTLRILGLVRTLTRKGR